ncbi:glycosyltransferase family 39 protein [Cellulomonas hominis]
MHVSPPDQPPAAGASAPVPQGTPVAAEAPGATHTRRGRHRAAPGGTTGDAAATAPGPGTEPATPDSPTHGSSDAPTELVPTEDRLLRRLLGARTLVLDATRHARLTGWLWPLAVTLLGGVARFWQLGRPHNLVFDETYYVKQAYSLLVQGYEGQWGDKPNPAFEAGDTSALQTTAEYVVHPPVGKWMIALGMKLGGGVDSSTAWRLASAICGTLAILMLARIARRLFASTALGTLAGLLLAVDGEAIVHSRTALLDGFLMFFVLAAFGALLLDREQARRRLAARTAVILDSGRELGWGPRLGWRWWRIAAGLLLGLATGTKWSGIYFLAVLGLLSVAWDATARRAVGVRQWHVAAVLRDGVLAGVTLVGLTAATYLASWTSWFLSPDAYLRQWAVQHPGEGVQWLPPALRSLWKFHTDMWHFHNTLTSPHTYAAEPLGWIVQWRPTSFFYPTDISGLTGDAARAACGADRCSQAITSLGNPLLWWLAAVAIPVAVYWLLRHRDWRAGAVLSGIVAGWLPWFAYMHRTIFTFYSIAFTPWVVLTFVYAVSLLVGPRVDEGGDPWRRRTTTRLVGVVVVLIVAVSAFFYPIWTAQVVPYDFWRVHMWLRSWI